MPGNIQGDQIMVQADSSVQYSVNTQFVQNGLSGRDSVQLSTVSLPSWTNLTDTTTCASTLLLGSSDISLTYLWSNNSMSPNFVIDSSQGGIYTVIVRACSGIFRSKQRVISDYH